MKEAIVAPLILVVGLVCFNVGVSTASDDDNRVNVTSDAVRGEEVFAWIDAPDGNKDFRCLVLVDGISNADSAGRAAAVWCYAVPK